MTSLSFADDSVNTGRFRGVRSIQSITLLLSTRRRWAVIRGAGIDQYGADFDDWT